MEINKSRRNLVSTNVLQVKGSPKFGQTDPCEVKVQMNMIKITTTHMTFCTSFFLHVTPVRIKLNLVYTCCQDALPTVVSHTNTYLTEIAHVVQYVWDIGELMVRCLRVLVPLRSSLKPSNTKSSPRLFFLLLSSPVIWAVFVQAALSLSSSPLSCAVLWTLSSTADHRVPTWIIRTPMKITVVRRDGIRWAPWALDEARWLTLVQKPTPK